jgi:hypothetical protein
MEPDLGAPHALILNSDLRQLGLDDRHLRRDDGLTPVRRGVYVRSDAARGLEPDAAYDIRIAAVAATRRAPIVLSYLSAARVWKLPIVNYWPAVVHILEPVGSYRRSKNGVVVHRDAVSADQFVVAGDVMVTSLAQTLVDLGRLAPMRDSVAAIDHALRLGLTTKDELIQVLHAMNGIHGRRRARIAIDFGNPLSNRPGESFSRVLMFELGFPEPQLQKEFVLQRGERRYGDFWWEKLRLLGEFDGLGKYFDASMAKGRPPQQIFADQQKRENEIRKQNVRVARWGWSDLLAVTPFVAQLDAAGLQRRRARTVVVPIPAGRGRYTGHK